MADLFENAAEEFKRKDAPLADRMRPENFDEFVGQQEIMGEEKVLRKAIRDDKLFSMLFWGPPGSGKTTLARLIAKQTQSRFVQLSAVSSGVKDLRDIIKKAEDDLKFHRARTILFIDEIHRWNKAQQDGLLPFVEQGTIMLIGATTENPSFEVISPLLSRSRVFVFQRLTEQEISSIIDRALKDAKRGLKGKKKLAPDARALLVKTANGDARIALNGLDVAAAFASAATISKKDIEEALQKRALLYDKDGEEHYNVISAFIKSLRGSSPDGALYWLARMLEAGEDPLFIARRMVILASEDIGNADPRAQILATSCFLACERIGLPEAQLTLAQCATYLATAPKSNAAYVGILKARQDAREHGNLPVPLHLRNASTDLMKDIGYGKEYKYSHDYEGEAGKQDYFPEELGLQEYYKEKPEKK
ncbi:MAG: replication-associated recombination protein A [Patescibacteria group bacterium]|jgi:putative ATPase